MSVQDILNAVRAGRISTDDAKAALRQRLHGEAPQPQPPQAAAEAAAPASPDAVAIIGISGRYPKAADLDRYWDNLLAGRDCIDVVPSWRWDAEQLFDPTPPHRGKVYCKWLGALDDVDCFDPLFFSISPADAEMMDPQHRLFMQEAFHAFEDAGYGNAALSNVKCGVYFGIMTAEYSSLATLSSATLGNMAGNMTGNSHSIGAARIAYHLNLRGPALAVDTACSSSLVATHLACQALRNGEIDMALAGGASLYLTAGSYIGMCAAGMLSPAGRCKTFDNSADGFVPGEGAGAVILKRLADAIADGDHIDGVILGSGINQDGRTNGITAPSKRAQIELELAVYDRFGIDPATISYAEMHGTGTKLGDPIELEALAAAFRARTPQRNFCAIGSVKSNIGHASAAAGVASIHKVLLCLRHGMLVPTLHFGRPNEHFDFADSPFRVNTAATPWPAQDTPRRATISSFGFSGTNAHLVIEEYRAPAAAAAVPGMQLLLLSARSEERLRIQAQALLQHLRAPFAGTLADLAYTLQVGRDAMECRLAVQADSLEALQQALANYLQDRSDARIGAGTAAAPAVVAELFDDEDHALECTRDWFARGRLDQLAAVWLKGFDVDWGALYARGSRRRLRLPTYPFEQGRYWLPQGEPAAAATPAAAGGDALHPLVQRNLSSFEQQRYAGSFSGEEFFFAEHRVNGARTLPAAALLEMARAAGALALNDAAAPLELAQVRWLRPVNAGDAAQAQALDLEITLRRSADGAIGFAVQSAAGQVHSDGQLRVHAAAAPQLDLAALRRAADAGSEMPAGMHYAIYEAIGIDYGPRFRTLQRLQLGADGVLAQLQLREAAAGFVLQPTLIDAAFQACIGLSLAGADAATAQQARPALPFALDALRLYAPLPASVWAWIRSKSTADAAVRRIDIDLCDDAGRVCATLRGLNCRVAGAAVPDGPGQLHAMAFEWQPLEPARIEPSPSAGDHLLAIGASEAQLERWRRAGQRISALQLPAALDEAALLARLQGLDAIDHVLWIAPAAPAAADADYLISAQQGGVAACFALTRALLQAGYLHRPLDWSVLTSQTQAVSADDAIDASQAALHGFAGTLAKECPRWRVRLLDLDSDARWSLDELRALPFDAAGDALARRGEHWFRRQIVPAQHDGTGVDYREGGLYLVVGGAGGVGAAWSEWMIRRYRAQIVWLGRREADAQIQADCARLGALGPAPLYLAADATDAAALQRARERLAAQFPGRALNGIVHSAVVLRDRSLAAMTAEDFSTVLAAKVDAAVRVMQVFGSASLDFVLFFSSLAAIFHEAGQANYAAGCAFQDAYARQLGAAGPVPVKVVNWGYWGSTGVAASAAQRERMARNGVGSIEPDEAFAALQQFLTGALPQLGVIKLLGEAAAPAAADDVLAVPAGAAPAGAAATPRDAVLRFLAGLVERVLKVPAARIDAARSLERYGLDSIVAMQLATALSEAVGEVDNLIFLEYPSLGELADHLLATRAGALARLLDTAAEAAPAPAAAAVLAAAPAVAAASGGDGIAVIGMAGRYAGSRTVDELWQHLAEGYDSVTEVPAERWNHADYYDADGGKLGKSYCAWGSFIDGVDEFDALFFDISPRTADALDPQIRLCLQTVWELMENAGHTRELIARRHEGRVGVYIGAMYQQYQMMETDYVVSAGVALSSYSGISNRVSNFFDFRGPSVAVDTQCSSSMIAIHEACSALRQGECELAVAGGVNLLIHPKKYIGLSILRMLGSHRDCRSFADGDGYLPAEGVGAVLLKPLQRAVDDGDNILAVIRYTGQNHSGRAFGYGTQDPRAQVELFRRALQRTGIDARTISYVETSANGTPLSDAIEAGALNRVHREFSRDEAYCAIGAIKSNMGHTESASGIAQLTKVILQLQHGQIAPMFMPARRNPKVSFDGTPFFLPATLMPWQRPQIAVDGVLQEFPRRAAINSFGGGGSLAHALVEEYVAADAGAPKAGAAEDPQLVPLSARSAERLRVHAAQIAHYLRARPQLDLADVAATLQRGREALEVRLALVVSDCAELAAALEQFAADPSAPLSGADEPAIADATPEWLRERFAEGDLEAVARHWRGGGEVDWNALHGHRRYRLVGLPNYPFARDRHWLQHTDATAYAQSRIVQGDFGAGYDRATQSVEDIVYSALSSALGIAREQLDLDVDLSRFVILPVFLPRLGHHLATHAQIRLDAEQLQLCTTARAIAGLALAAEEAAGQ
ncbi:SDR family NAD(P)-dependent oxidoreductase [Tahibacter harae]|uniref:SDR family NAD(P)-dependent oxidoreductase n=1 Tax=Tahibacter harae TaxID=2963937 RepID=A0ABT1QLT1_9GAMM|nr:SDR family NAD(P)-dependent oxidoreductase [Tahibacter harae]MCQ4163483.1 SDR family NAD(P)-dependent oxidoreductase [Tahibacter harae]